MKKLNLSIVIPTRDRLDFLTRTLVNLKKNDFFFSEIIVVDSSRKENKKNLNNLKNSFNINIKIIHSTPGISKQRNKGLKNVNKNSKYVMFLDDDIIFEKKAMFNMYNFLKLNPKYVGIGFNPIIKDINRYVESIKKNKFTRYLGIYDFKSGKVTPSGWQTKAINLKKNEHVDWLTTQAVIYSYKTVRREKFDTNYGSYSYLEDLDFSYNLKNKGLIINSQAKYSDNNIVIRNPFYLGLKEIVNRYYFVKKFKLRKSNFLIGCFFSIIKHLILFFTFKPSYLIRIIGNIVGLIKISI
tara:strand:- start:150 stop:1040 length:891 start_codon:yes stop_codon:yes gene_type:complete